MAEKKETAKEIAKMIAEASVIELNDAIKILEEEYGIKVQAPVAASTSAAPAAAPAEEKSVFNIELKSVGDKKIEVIKAARDITGKGLKEAKDLVDAAVSAPQMVKENVKKEEAEEIKKKFEAAGAQVELK